MLILCRKQFWESEDEFIGCELVEEIRPCSCGRVASREALMGYNQIFNTVNLAFGCFLD